MLHPDNVVKIASRLRARDAMPRYQLAGDSRSARPLRASVSTQIVPSGA